MAPVLDATNIQDESEVAEPIEAQEPKEADVIDNDAGGNQAEPQAEQTADEYGQFQYVTLAMPEDCNTDAKLIIQQGPDGRYRNGFHVARQYDSSPYDTAVIETPSSTEDDEGCPTVEEAVDDAAGRVAEWIRFHSADDDSKADEAAAAIEKWQSELTDAFVKFDPMPDDNQAVECPTPEPIVEPVTEPTATQPATPPALDPQAYFEQRRHELEKEIGELAIEAQRLKAAVKCNREAMSAATDELQQHLATGPVRLPLFDQPPQPADSHDPDDCCCPTCAKARVAKQDAKAASDSTATPDSTTDAAVDWHTVKVESLGIDPKLCIILREENSIYTLGDIAEYTKQYQLTDLKKIGPSKAAKIEEALDDYWKKHPQA